MSATGLVYSPSSNPPGVGDRAKYVAVKRSTLQSVRTNYEAYAGKILDGGPTGTPAPLVYSSLGAGGAEAAGAGCTQPGQGTVGTDGYAFPMEPQTKAVKGIRVGQTTATHWDGTDAYDLFSTVDADVYSIYAGTPTKINTSVKGVEGCTSIQFKADDGFYYWYGHLKNPVVQEGVHIDAGVKMAEIADTSLTTTCTGNGGPHLHIDRGCTIDAEPQPGGTDECRDPAFIPFLSRIYEKLP
jgi:murein DD-endopeptidase MepM/ murein hydrolase activator NlpD